MTPPADPAAHPTILVLAGEASGDQHAAALVAALRRRYPRARFVGTGGDRMEAEGVELLAHLDQLAVMGFIEILPKLAFFRGLERHIGEILDGDRPDLVILVDYPGLNLRVARRASGKGIPVLYYIAPKVWAWRSGRARTLAESTDGVAVILPFEEEFLEGWGATVTYVGNPLLDRPDDVAGRAAFCAEWELDEEKSLLAVLPGSRAQELQRHLDPFLEIAEEVARRRPEVLPVFSRARTVDAGAFADVPFPVVEDTRALLRHADAALVKSGTSTLETALEETPFVVAYRTSPVTMWLARRLVDLPHVGLPNLILDETVVPEFYQREVTAEQVAPVLLELLDAESERRRRQLADLERVRDRMGEPGAAERVAEMAAELLEERGG